MQKKIGRLFVNGFTGTERTTQARFLVEELKIGNWIFFARNIESHEQAGELCRQMIQETQQYNGCFPFMTIDQEGGIVSRLHGDLNTYPGAMASAATSDLAAVKQAGRITATHLRSLGFNMNLAPCCDINSNPDNPIIGPRSYGDTPEVVSRFTEAVAQGYRDGGIVPVLKHFPGHGDTAVDSHLNLPLLPHTHELLENRELQPFIHNMHNAAIMVAHILVPALDNSGLPASLSEQIIDHFLRHSLGFQGLVLTDCLEMNAVRNQYTSEEAVLLALKAGADLFFISHTVEEQEKGFRAVYDAVISGKIKEARIDQSLKRIRDCQERFLPHIADKPLVLGWRGENPDPFLQEISKKSITLIRNKAFLPSGGLPDSAETLILVLQRPEQFIGENTVSGGNPLQRIGVAFPKSRFHLISADSATENIVRVAQTAIYAQILLITSDAGFYPSAMAAIQKISEFETPVGVAVMRTPYEAAYFTGADFVVLCYEDTVLAVDSLIAVLQGKMVALGSCPVHIPGMDE